MDGSAYVVRRSLHDVANIRKAKKALRTAFEVQRAGLGFSMVELLSSCPTNWGISAPAALTWIEEHMIPAFPLGDYKVHPAAAALEKAGK
jgi:2-oxoglutarate ferredoxin oxidoreductase subunit beta